MNQTPQEILQSVFGYGEFRPHQQEIIDGITSHRDAFDGFRNRTDRTDDHRATDFKSIVLHDHAAVLDLREPPGQALADDAVGGDDG